MKHFIKFIIWAIILFFMGSFIYVYFKEYAPIWYFVIIMLKLISLEE